MYLTYLSQPVLYESDFCDRDEKGNVQHGYQTLFCAMSKAPTIHVGGSGDDGGGGEGTITLEIHRYKP